MSNQESTIFSEVQTQVMMSPVRLPIVVLLALYEEADFTFIKKELKMSDGNLGANLKKLEAQKLVKSKKMFVGAKPKTQYRITQEGKSELQCFFNTITKIEVAVAKSN